MPKDPSICCDICHPDLVRAMINECDDDYQTAPRGSNLPKWLPHALTFRASQSRDALYIWRTEMATGLFGLLDHWPANLFLHKEIVEDIVALINANKIVTLQDLRKKTNWILCEQYGDQIVSLIQWFFPLAPLPNLFVSTPLPLQTHKTGRALLSNVLNSPPPSLSSTGIRKPRAPSTCTVCFQKGHRSTSSPFFSPPSTDAMQQRMR